MVPTFCLKLGKVQPYKCQIINYSNYFGLFLRTDAETRQNASGQATRSLKVNEEYLCIYAGLVGAIFLVGFTQIQSTFRLVLTSSNSLHSKLFEAILHAPVRFFEDTKGLTLKLFSNDIGTTDEFINHLTIQFVYVRNIDINICVKI